VKWIQGNYFLEMVFTKIGKPAIALLSLLSEKGACLLMSAFLMICMPYEISI